jgi:hypothetical protein
MIIIKLFLIYLHCHIKFAKKKSPPPENVYIFEALWLYSWRFAKKIRKQIWSKLTVFYQKWLSFHKNNDFITQILPENVKIET